MEEAVEPRPLSLKYNLLIWRLINVRLILYSKVGHMPPMEIPEILAEDIKNFIVN